MRRLSVSLGAIAGPRLWTKYTTNLNLFDMPLQCLKAFRADHMLNSAGVIGGCFRRHAKADQPGGQKFMPFIDALGDLPAGIGQRDRPFRGDLDAAVLPELFHGDADTGFFEIQFCRDIY